VRITIELDLGELIVVEKALDIYLQHLIKLSGGKETDLIKDVIRIHSLVEKKIREVFGVERKE